MRKDKLPSSYRPLLALLILALCAAATHADDYTALLVSAQNPRTYLFPGTDGKQHVVYELMMTNASRTPVTVQKVEVFDADNPSKVLATYEGAALPQRLRKMAQGPSPSAEIEVNGSRLFFIDLDLGAGVTPPTRLLHRLSILAAAPGAASNAAATYTVAPISIVSKVTTIGPPLTGAGWVALNGCCAPDGAHRGTGLPVNGSIHFAQRFAIDWLRLDNQGRVAHGDLSDVHSYAGYGADVIAVADGTITETLDTLPEQKPPNNPDPKTINLENIGGNHVIQDLGNGVFAFYAHLQPGSIKVAVGDHVKRGQILGLLGNTGNSSAPHLHFHLMDGPSMLGSSGIPYVFNSFALAGQIPETPGAPEQPLDASQSKSLFPAPSPRQQQFPLDQAIIDFHPSR